MRKGVARSTSTSVALGLGLPLSADRHPGDLFVQRLAAGHGLGRLVDALVRRRCCNDRAMLDAAWVTLRIARAVGDGGDACSARSPRSRWCALGRFRGRTLFSGMIYAPLVMPEVITGLSLLLLFVALDVDRGFWTVTLAHITLTVCFVTVVVQSRLLDLRPQPRGGGDGSRLPAAEDLPHRHAAADRRRRSRRAGCSPSRCRSTIW